MATYDNLWQLLPQVLSSFGNLWQMLGNLWQLLVTFGKWCIPDLSVRHMCYAHTGRAGHDASSRPCTSAPGLNRLG